MTRCKRWGIAVILLSPFVLGSVTIALAAGMKPFQLLYKASPSKSLFLGYVRLSMNLADQPFAINEAPVFLGERVNLTTSQRELKVLLEFAYDDLRFPLHFLDEQGRAKLIALIIQEVNNTDDSARIRKSLIMLENCRVRYDRDLYKPYLQAIPNLPHTPKNQLPRSRPFTANEIGSIRNALNTWWGDGTRWPSNRDEDHLGATPFKVRQMGG